MAARVAEKCSRNKYYVYNLRYSLYICVHFFVALLYLISQCTVSDYFTIFQVFEEPQRTIRNSAYLEEPGVDGRIGNVKDVRGMDLCGSKQWPEAGCCEYCHKCSVLVIAGVFLK
jgi:hypothetical protein